MSTKKKFWALFALLAFLIPLTACNRLSDGSVSSGTADTFDAAGESTWAANTGAHYLSSQASPNANAKITAGTLFWTGVPTGFTGLSGAIHLDASDPLFTSGTGTTSDPYIFSNHIVVGCIGIHTDNVKITNVWQIPQIVSGNLTTCEGGRNYDSGGAAALPGISMGQDDNDGDGNTQITGTIVDHWSWDGQNTHGAGMFVNYAGLQYSDATNSDIIILVAGHSTVQHNYIHDVAQLHGPGCNGYNDAEKDANGWWVCRPENTQDEANWHQDFHRDTIWAQGSNNWTLYDNYVVHSHLHYVAAYDALDGSGPGYDFTDHSSGACLCDKSGGWGPTHDFVMSNNYMHGGGGANVFGNPNGEGGYHIVYEHNRFDGSSASHGATHGYIPGNPCDQSDYTTGSWSTNFNGSTGLPVVTASYFDDNSRIDVAGSPSEVALTC